MTEPAQTAMALAHTWRIHGELERVQWDLPQAEFGCGRPSIVMGEEGAQRQTNSEYSNIVPTRRVNPCTGAGA